LNIRASIIIVQDWLGLDNLTLGGPYGEAAPSDLEFLTISSDGLSTRVEKYPIGSINNSLSPLSNAEMFRRLILHDILDPELQFPGLTNEDQVEILYGAKQSDLFPGQSWGGASADPGIFLQSALNLESANMNNDDWRIFSKLGAGYSTYRQVGEVLTNSYGCLPIDNDYYEFTISIRTSIPFDFLLQRADQEVHQVMVALIENLPELCQ